MPLSCFARGGKGSGGDPSTAPPASTTSVYWTHLGGITLTWYRASLGLLLAVELRLAGEHDAPAPDRFVLRPWLPWRRRGSKRFVTACGRAVAVSWDLSRARLAARRPEPVSRYILRVSVDGELALAAGDRAPAAGLLLSRRENAVVAGGGDAYSTTVAVAGEEHEVTLGVEDAAMWVAVDGEKALQVRRLRWKFRGSERLDLPGGRLRVTWDLHSWLFRPDASDASAVFVLRFETSDPEDAVDTNEDEVDTGMRALARQSSLNNNNNHHGGGGGESCGSSDSERRGWGRRGPFRSGSDTSPSVSVASTSAASSAGSVTTVSHWAGAALKDGGGFSLLVHLWKKKK